MTSDTRSKHPRTTVVASITVALAVLLALAYVAQRQPHARAAMAVEKLTLALPTTPHAALMYIAAANGYFAEEGLDVNITPVSHGKAAMDLLAEGKADLITAAEVPFVIAVLKNAPVSIVATIASVSDEMAIIARRDHGIGAPHDLVGKKIGVTFGTSGEYFLWAFLIRNRLPPESITMVDMAPAQMVAALSDGSVDAVSTWEPIKASARAALAANAFTFTEGNAYTVTHVVVGSTSFLNSHAGAMEKLTRALVKAERFNHDQPAQALALVATRLSLKAGLLERGWANLSLKVDLRQSQLVTLEDEARWATARGYAERGPLPNFLQHLDLAALLAMDADRVTVVH